MTIPLRMCAVSREMKQKNELIRLVKVGDSILIDTKQKMQGRGLWICKSADCLTKLQKSKCLNRGFKCEIKDEVYQMIQRYIDGQK